MSFPCNNDTMLHNMNVPTHYHASRSFENFCHRSSYLNRTRKPFSKEDTIHVVDWLARNNPNGDSRRGTNLWKQLMTDSVRSFTCYSLLFSFQALYLMDQHEWKLGLVSPCLGLAFLYLLSYSYSIKSDKSGDYRQQDRGTTDILGKVGAKNT